jgi:hypothetical protein
MAHPFPRRRLGTGTFDLSGLRRLTHKTNGSGADRQGLPTYRSSVG